MKFIVFIILNLLISLSALANDYCYIEKQSTGEKLELKKQIIDNDVIYSAELDELRVEIIPRANNYVITRFLSNSDQFTTIFTSKKSKICPRKYSRHTKEHDLLMPNGKEGGQYKLQCNKHIECNPTPEERGDYLFNPTIKAEDKVQFAHNKVFFATHSAYRWGASFTEQAMLDLSEQIQNFKGLKVAVAVESIARKAFNFDIRKMDQLLDSFGGAHSLVFPNAEEVFFTGGFLDQCLCESFRDVLTALDFSSSKKTIYFINEGTYLIKHPQWDILTADQLIKDKKMALDWIDKMLLGEDKVCPAQRTMDTPDHNRKDYTVSIYFNDEESPSRIFGDGEKELNIKFISKDNFIKNHL